MIKMRNFGDYNCQLRVERVSLSYYKLYIPNNTVLAELKLNVNNINVDVRAYITILTYILNKLLSCIH